MSRKNGKSAITLRPDSLSGLLQGLVASPAGGLKQIKGDDGNITHYKVWFTVTGRFYIGSDSLDLLLSPTAEGEIPDPDSLDLEHLKPGIDYADVINFGISHRSPSGVHDPYLDQMAELCSGDQVRIFLSLPWNMRGTSMPSFSAFPIVHRFRLVKETDVDASVDYHL